MLAGGCVAGLDQFAEEDRPPVWIVFWSFRIMVGMGLVMLTLGIWGAAAWALKRLDAATLVSSRARARGTERVHCGADGMDHG
jgi:cytochrome bd-type quinol oxidase subunit 1